MPTAAALQACARKGLKETPGPAEACQQP